MKSRIETACNCFAKGFNCAQAVFSTYASLVGIKQEDALRIATGFGAGMGRLQEVCGVVTGVFMLIGCKHGMTDTANASAKEAAYACVQDFTQRFRKLHGSPSCRELLGCDLNTADGKQHFKGKDLFSLVCLPCVQDACRLIEEIVFTEHD